MKKVKLPEGISKFAKSNSGFMYLDGFEWTLDNEEDFNAWFGTEEGDHNSYLFCFAQDGAGGMFCFWRETPGNDFSNTHVIYLSSEGEVGYISKNFIQFLELLATGYILFSLVCYGDAYRFDQDVDDEEKKESNEEHNSLLKKIKSVFNAEPLRSVDDFLSKRKENNHLVEAWIESRKSK